MLSVDSNYSRREYFVEESFDNYIQDIVDLTESTNRENKDKGIIISGAIPSCDVVHQQRIKDALYAISKEVFRRNGKIIFGSHPTFQPLIFDTAKNVLKDEYKDSVNMYISKYFKSSYDLDELMQNSNVYECDVVGNLSSSLTNMRKQMINDSCGQALICIGGKTKVENQNPGLDEEIELAIARGIPVFIIGSAGGRAAELAVQYDNENWICNINNLTPDENKELMVSLDYNFITTKILDHLNI